MAKRKGKVMDTSIGGVIDTCERITRIPLIGQDRDDCTSLVGNILSLHSNYDLDYLNPDASYNRYPYFFAVVDHLQVSLYLDGKLEITAGRRGEVERRKILSPDDLWMLKFCEIGYGSGRKRERVRQNRTDMVLLRLVGRIEDRVGEWNLPNWGQHIDETGSFPLIAKHLGRAIDYHMVKTTPSPGNRHPLRGRSYA